MKFRVSGVDRKSGRDAMVTVEAPDAQRAEAAAMKQLMVAEVEPDHGGGVAAALAREAEDLAESKRIAKGLPLSYAPPQERQTDPPPAPLATPLPSVVAVQAPAYPDIVKGANVLHIVAMILVIVGAVGALLAAVALANAGDTLGMVIGPLLMLGIFVAAAALLRLIASVSLAVRDMARNSFRR